MLLLHRLVIVVAIVLVGGANADTSELWGTDGDLYKPLGKGGRLMRWDSSGYQAYTKPLPRYDSWTKFNVLDYGAKANDNIDDTAAFLKAIAAAGKKTAEKGAGAVIEIPAGRFIISKRLIIDSPKTVLKGAGRLKTTLYIPVTLDEIDNVFERALYSWGDGIIRLQGPEQKSKDTANLLGRVTKDTALGSHRLFFNDTSKFKKDEFVLLYMSNPLDNSLAIHLYNNQPAELCLDLRRGFCIAGLAEEGDMVALGFTVKEVGPNYVDMYQELPFDVRTKWKASVHKFANSLNSGVEGFTVEYKWTPSEEHHYERGTNAFFVNSAANVFVKDVRALNCDVGLVTKNLHFATIDKVAIGYTKSRATTQFPWQGHIGLGMSLRTSRSTVSNFKITGYWLHGITNRRSYLTVYRNGIASSLSIDFHRKHPYGNLLSNIDAGMGMTHTGEDVFTTTGGNKMQGMPAASYNTIWNVRKNSGPISIPTYAQHGPCTYGTKLNWVGNYKGFYCDGWSVEKMLDTSPNELFGSQMAKFKNRTGSMTKIVVAPVTNDAITSTNIVSPAPAPVV